MAKIAVLDKNMINMIAAGEVIERPSSVVKEFMENSIDAGASRIVVKIEDGGKKLISVTDDGEGISPEDIPNAFEPHATSKIRIAQDLAAISSMGFRGEALASIASIAQVRLTSRTIDSIQANQIEIDCGEKSQVLPTSGDYGTTVEVRNIFYKLPARRKFLKTSNTEMNHIVEHFTRIALANEKIDLTLIHNNRQVYKLTPCCGKQERICQIMPKLVTADLITAQSDEKNIKIMTFAGKPSSARSTSKYQYVFLNGRYIKDKFVLHALKEAYRGLVEPNKYPAMFIFLEMPFDSYDVNVHPTKVEVRFDNPNMVHSQILATLREKLLSSDLDVSVSLSHSTAKIDPTMFSDKPYENPRSGQVREAISEFFMNSPKQNNQGNLNFSSSTNAKSASTYVSPSIDRKASSFREYNNYSSHSQSTDFSSGQVTSSAGKIMQVHDTYIIIETLDGFSIIDQHALHEKIIYEKMQNKLNESNTLESQKMLIPQTIEITSEQKQAIEENTDLFDKLGISLEAFGPGTVAIQSFPTLLRKADHVDFVIGIIDLICDRNIKLPVDELMHEIFSMAACKAAVKAGKRLSIEEMNQLLSDKERMESSCRCPHGRPTVIKYSIAELEKEFKRTGF